MFVCFDCYRMVGSIGFVVGCLSGRLLRCGVDLHKLVVMLACGICLIVYCVLVGVL